MINAAHVSACLVTRGDQPEQLARIIETLPYGEVFVWDNSRSPDMATAGRYAAMECAIHDIVYFQDDDTLFIHHDELMAAYQPGTITAVYAHGENDGGYGDVAMVGAGAIADRIAVRHAIKRYKGDTPWTGDDRYYADFAVGILAPSKQVHLPFEINLPIAQHPSRLCNQPWAADAKRRVAERARAIRDAA